MAEIERLAARQHGLVTLEQLIRLGFSVDMVRARVARGEFVRVHRGLFRLRGALTTWHQSLMAAVLLGGARRLRLARVSSASLEVSGSGAACSRSQDLIVLS